MRFSTFSKSEDSFNKNTMKSKLAERYLETVAFPGDAGYQLVSVVNARIACERAEKEIVEEVVPTMGELVRMLDDLSKVLPLIKQEAVYKQAKYLLDKYHD
jgi:hypothetical protein